MPAPSKPVQTAAKKPTPTGPRHVAAPSAQNVESTDHEHPWFHQHVVWGVLAAAGTIALAGILLGSLPIKIAAVVLALTTLQGLWRGCAEIIGFVAGMILAALVAPPLGKALEGVVSSVAGTAGIVNRVISIVLVALFITAVVGIAGSVLAKRFLKQRPDLRAYDKYAGAALGLVEGCFVALLVLWVPMALRPVAQIAAATDRELQTIPQDRGGTPRPTAPSWAGELITFADTTQQSFVGGLVESTNPLPDSRLLSLAADFSAISRDEEAMTQLLQSEPMQQLQNLSSVQQALDAIKNDPQLANLVSDSGVTTEGVLSFFNSDTMLRVLDTTTVVQDAAPIISQLEQAIHETKARLDQRTPKGGG